MHGCMLQKVIEVVSYIVILTEMPHYFLSLNYMHVKDYEIPIGLLCDGGVM